MITATVLVFVIILLTLAYFYLNCTLVKSFSALMALIATAIGVHYHEVLANLLISIWTGQAFGGCFGTFITLRCVPCQISSQNRHRSGQTAKSIAAIVCGLSPVDRIGHVTVAMGLMPVQHKVAYSQFSADSPLI